MKNIARPLHILDSASFTTFGALAREILAWLEFSPCKIIVNVHSENDREALYGHMEDVKTMGRVVVKVTQ